ncbi:MAG: GNAT family N-acetyltransferase [Nocardioides sp.]
MSELPAGLTTRPLEPGDSRAVYELMAASEKADIGLVEIEEADIVGDWQRPSHDLSARSVGVFDDDRLVAYGELTWEQVCDAAVHPDHRGHGIGTWLAARIQQIARQYGSTVVGMPVPEGSPGDRLLEQLGYFVRWTSWVLKVPEGRTIVERRLPDGYSIRTADTSEYEQIWTVVEDAFLEWSDRERSSLKDFAALVWQRPGFEPWHLRVVLGPDGAVVGVANTWNVETDGAVETFVSRLGVHQDHRTRGLAQSLLVDASTRAVPAAPPHPACRPIPEPAR